MRRRRFWTATLVLLLTLAHLPAGHAAPTAAPTIYIVTNTDDSGANSLRWAINQANVDGEESLIIFDIPGTGVHTIQPLTPLPALVEDTTQTLGHTQPGWVAATDTTPATLVVEIDGSLAGPGNGFSIISANNWISGLVINRFDWNGVAIFSFGGSSATNNAVFGNHIGTDAAGTVDLGNGYTGVSISLGAQDNLVGGTSPDMRNVISGNDWEGVGIHGENTTGNIVCGNYIGTAANGTDPLGNALHGVRIYGGAHDNDVGGEAANRRNVISGNDRDGVYIAGAGTRGNVVAGNYIGLSADGAADLGNSQSGVCITAGAQENDVAGNDTVSAPSVISGNGWHGVVISGTGTASNTIAGNYIGMDVYGTIDLGNDECGVAVLWGAQNNTIGSDDVNRHNFIWHNDGAGVQIAGASTMSNTVLGNKIYDNQNGIRIINAQDNVIGGDTESERNAIYGNRYTGVYIRDFAQNNTVAGNNIGIDASGDAAGNGTCGVGVESAQRNTIGPGNVISSNTWDGVVIEDGQDNVILGNYIGTNASGALAPGFGNGANGVWLDLTSTGNTIGGKQAGAGNVIAGNGGHGVHIVDNGSVGNPITRNSIYGNVGDGIQNPGLWTSWRPVIDSVGVGSSIAIVGTACPGCTVEVFQNSDADGEGETFVGDAIADGNYTFTVTVSALTKPYLTATATKANNTTSKFSAVYTHTVHSVLLPLVMNGY